MFTKPVRTVIAFASLFTTVFAAPARAPRLEVIPVPITAALDQDSSLEDGRDIAIEAQRLPPSETDTRP